MSAARPPEGARTAGPQAEGTPVHDAIVWLHHAGQSLGLVPSLGGGVAAWRTQAAPRGHPRPLDLWRPWDGSADLYAMASFAMVPWSNRITASGFVQDGVFHPVAPNRRGEPYPIHGDGWLQPWACTQPAADTLELRLRSDRFAGNPYAYEALQRFRLAEGAMHQSVEVRHLGERPLPYGLGLHPWFEKTPRASVTAAVDGVWLSGRDPIPTGYATDMPPDWNLARGIGAHGSFIDNAFGGWDGEALIAWPERGVRLAVSARGGTGQARRSLRHCLVYRPPAGPAFCFEPITHPIDAFHQDGRPGLEVLSPGESLHLEVAWRFSLGRPETLP